MERYWWIVLMFLGHLTPVFTQVHPGVVANNRFLQLTNPSIKRALDDFGTSLEHPEIQRLARQMVDLGVWPNLKIWVHEGLVKQRTSGSDVFISKMYDISGRNNDASQTTDDNQPKLASGVLTFDGVNDTEVITYTEDMNVQTFSVLFWIRRLDASLATNDQYLGRVAAASPLEFPYRFTSRGVGAGGSQVFCFDFFTSTTTHQVNDPAGISTNTNIWYMYTGTAEKSGTSTILKLYRYDTEIASNTFAALIPQRNTNFTIGGENARRWINCDISDVRFFNSVLTASQISQIYNLTKSKYGL